MEYSSDTIDQLRNFEQRLLDPKVRASPEELDALLADNFREFGSSGRGYDRASIVRELAKKPGFDGSRTTRTISDFHAELLSPTVVLITYRIMETTTLRSSIWQLSSDRWQLVFHQGTYAMDE